MYQVCASGQRRKNGEQHRSIGFQKFRRNRVQRSTSGVLTIRGMQYPMNSIDMFFLQII